MKAAFLGIDSGTQSTKAILVEADTGRVLSLGRAPHALLAEKPGQKEQHPQWWVEALTHAVQEALASSPGVEVLAIGVSGQQHGLVMLDGSDAVLRPAKLWNDVTSAPQCERLMDRLGGVDTPAHRERHPPRLHRREGSLGAGARTGDLWTDAMDSAPP
jgi:xylulokinase